MHRDSDREKRDAFSRIECQKDQSQIEHIRGEKTQKKKNLFII